MVEGFEVAPGQGTVIRSQPDADSPLQVVFEDDGSTGFLYVLDHRRTAQPVVDALHIYNAKDEQSDRPFTVQVLWNRDGAAAVLLIDELPVAMVDYVAPRFMCRSGHPAPARGAPVDTHAWDEDALRARFL
jgi:hypothetical protein